MSSAVGPKGKLHRPSTPIYRECVKANVHNMTDDNTATDGGLGDESPLSGTDIDATVKQQEDE